MQQYVALRRLRLFAQHRQWKAFTAWAAGIRASKMANARAVLQTQLLVLQPAFHLPLRRLQDACHKLSGMRLHSLCTDQVRKGRVVGG